MDFRKRVIELLEGYASNDATRTVVVWFIKNQNYYNIKETLRKNNSTCSHILKKIFNENYLTKIDESKINWIAVENELKMKVKKDQ